MVEMHYEEIFKMIIKANLSQRKRRLFIIAMCKNELVDGRSRLAVGLAERYADGNLSKNDLEDAYSTASAAIRELWYVLEGTLEEQEFAVSARYACHSVINIHCICDSFLFYGRHYGFEKAKKLFNHIKGPR